MALSLAFRVAMLRGKAEQMNCKLQLATCGQEMVVRFLKRTALPGTVRPNDDLAGLVNKDRVKFEVRLIKYEDGCLVFNGFIFGRILLTGEPFQLYA